MVILNHFNKVNHMINHLPISELVDEDTIVYNRNNVLEETILKNNVVPQRENENEQDED